MTNPFPPEPYLDGVDDESGPVLPAWYTRGWTAQNGLGLGTANFPAPPQGDGFINTFPVDQLFSSLSQQYYDADSNPIGGFLTFWPSDGFTITESSVTWRVPQRLLGTLTFPDDNSGVSPWAFSMEGSGRIFIWSGQLVVRLFNTDNPNLVTDSGNPLTYHVTEHFRGGREFDITVPSSLSGLSPLYAQIVTDSAKPFPFDPVDPLGYLGADIDTPPGQQSSGGSGMSFIQPFTNVDSVTVNHNLGEYPDVQIIDSSGDVIFGAINHSSVNSLTVTFSQALTGTVVCN